MQIRNFNLASTLTPGISNSNSTDLFDAKVATNGFAALLRRQNLSSQPVPVRAPAPAQFSASVIPPAPASPPLPALPALPAPAPAPATTSMRTSQSTPEDKALPATPTSKEPPAPCSPYPACAPQNAKPARAADKSGPAKVSRSSSESAHDLPVDKTKKAETTTVGDEGVTPDPTLNPQLADLHQPAEPAPSALGAATHTAKPGTGDPAAADDAPVTSAKHGGVDRTAPGTATMKADELPDKSVRDPVVHSGSLPASEFAAAFAELRPATSPATKLAAASDIAAAVAAAASSATFNSASNATRELALAHGINLPTPVGAPDFAQHLGAQLSVLARDGVQQAELHLNPADMGPVSIVITMDGTQARIDFGADVAATRQVIEAGMPELASALADAGFTLAGGGVSQHPRGRGEGGRGESGSNPSARRAATGSTEAAPTSRVIHRTVSAGGVDIYA